MVIIINNSLIRLPAHKSLRYNWNFGSFLIIVIIIQIMSGLLLATMYKPIRDYRFENVLILRLDSSNGFFLRVFHLNIASLIFFLLYTHIFRGLFYKRFFLIETWIRGVTLLLLRIGIAFLGYVLPWGQISLWGATVITNLISAIPVIGKKIVIWVWGGFRVNTATLRCFYILHFLLPFVLLGIIIVHIIVLHRRGSRSKLLLHTNEAKIKFNPLYSFKDIINISFIIRFIVFILFNPFALGDPENFIEANYLISPIHIKPEWYFLYAYAILRCIPNKLGGVVALVLSVVVFYFLPSITNWRKSALKLHKMVFWLFIFNFFLLTWLGGNPVERPFIFIRQVSRFLYFFLLFVIGGL